MIAESPKSGLDLCFPFMICITIVSVVYIIAIFAESVITTHYRYKIQLKDKQKDELP
jgi:hypothetical protein